MKVTAHLVVSKGYSRAIIASQSINEVVTHCEEYNEEHWGENYRTKDRERAVITVEFEVPDEIFKRQPIVEVPGKVIENPI